MVAQITVGAVLFLLLLVACIALAGLLSSMMEMNRLSRQIEKQRAQILARLMKNK